jgi:UDP-N-acetylglucosamine 2-epimerase (non-hydrolysing)
MAPLLKQLKNDPLKFEVKSCSTGQHREMLDQVLDFFKIVPDYDLSIMRENQSLVDLSCNLLKAITSVIEEFQPDLLFVQGDTTTAFIASLAAFYTKVKVAHLEAGLRTGFKYSPFPEEVNRILTSHLSYYHFAPTSSALQNLRNEGITSQVYLVGNTVVDALLMTLNIIESNKENKYKKYFEYLNLKNKIILVTAHRRESFGQPLENICNAINDITAIYDDVEIVFPVHLNPQVSKLVHGILGKNKKVHLIGPLEYPYLIWLLSISYLVLTDSGGIQEEAPSLGKPVLVMREVTERMEGIEAGTAKLVGTSTERIVEEITFLISEPARYLEMSTKMNPYGDGMTSKNICDIISL